MEHGHGVETKVIIGSLPYFKTKAQAEQALFGYLPNATVLRPSILFGPGDGFFAVSVDRHSQLSRLIL